MRMNVWGCFLFDVLRKLCLLSGDGSAASSHSILKLDGGPVPLGSTATHESIWTPKSMWARWKPLDMNKQKQTSRDKRQALERGRITDYH